MRVYISGPMSGLPELNFPAFNAEAARLRALGYEVVNPAEINPGGDTWNTCMRRDIAELVFCDMVVTLPGWLASNGASFELLIAKKLEMRIIRACDLVEMQEAA